MKPWGTSVVSRCCTRRHRSALNSQSTVRTCRRIAAGSACTPSLRNDLHRLFTSRFRNSAKFGFSAAITTCGTSISTTLSCHHNRLKVLKIGRASCRERRKVTVGADDVNQKKGDKATSAQAEQ